MHCTRHVGAPCFLLRVHQHLVHSEPGLEHPDGWRQGVQISGCWDVGEVRRWGHEAFWHGPRAYPVGNGSQAFASSVCIRGQVGPSNLVRAQMPAAHSISGGSCELHLLALYCLQKYCFFFCVPSFPFVHIYLLDV